jgi:hypothetical protein
LLPLLALADRTQDDLDRSAEDDHDPDASVPHTGHHPWQAARAVRRAADALVQPPLSGCPWWFPYGGAEKARVE